MREGRRPERSEAREGAHRGELQYALSKTTPSPASPSRLGVLATPFPYAGSAAAASWSAMTKRMFGRRWLSRMQC